MGYLILLVLIILFCVILKVSSNYLLILAGFLIILHPILIAKEQAAAAAQLSIFVFLLFLSALFIQVIKKILPLKIDEQDSLFVDLIKKNVKIKITGVRIGNSYIKKNYLLILLAIIFVFLIWKVSLTAAGFSVLFLAFIINKWDSRIIAAFALVSLGACPFLLIFKQEALAENFAIYAYYFLALTVILQIIEYRRDGKISDQEAVNQKIYKYLKK